MSGDVDSEELFARMFAVHHRVLVDLERVAAFEEWSPFEVLAMRVFSLYAHRIGAIDIARSLGCSLPYASRLSKKLACEEWTRDELPCLTAVTAHVFGDLLPEERVELYTLLGRIRRSASG
jgi:hypothetical protein